MKKLGFGLMRLPLLDKNDQTSIDMPQLEKMVDVFLERGFTYFDTAYMYHEFSSEKAIKAALVDRYSRDSFTLTSKLPIALMGKGEEQESIFPKQLSNCGVDFFDYYLLHNLGQENYRKAQEFGSFEFVSKLKAEGKIRHIGISFHDSAELLDRILTEHPEVELVQLQINYLDWENESIQSRRCLETARAHGKDVIVMEPVKGGTLAELPTEATELMRAYAPEKSLPSWAIRFAASQESVIMVLSGMSCMEQLLDNTDYMAELVPLNHEEREIIRRVTDILKGSPVIGCTACRYCVEGCPVKIPIPEFFALYNAEKVALNKDFSTQATYYDNLTETGGRASDCIQCGQCAAACPQKLPIPELMRQVAKTFE